MSTHDDPPGSVSVSVDGATGTATRERHGWEVDLTAGSGRLDVPIGTRLLDGLVERIRGAGGGTTRWRVPVATPEHLRIAEAAGFRGDRILLQMRRALPAPPPTPPLPTRPFVPGADDDEWLRVNNAAFSWHPEQGGWDRAVLSDRLREPWVDPDGFLLHSPGDRTEPGAPIDAFCWTKVHRDVEPPLGEIFVIAVDPSAVGTGLGRRMVLAGLAHLSERGLDEAMLYTEAGNAAAVGLYRDLGFTTHHDVRVFERDVEAQTPTPTSEPMP